jgi:hypothetical protein
VFKDNARLFQQVLKKAQLMDKMKELNPTMTSNLKM